MKLSKIDLPQNLQLIGESAFKSCQSLQSVYIPDSVTSIERSVFSDCKRLESIDLPDTVSLGKSAFSGCESLQHIELPSSMATVPFSLFDGCKSLSRVIIPDGVAEIEADAFASCINLEYVYIPNSVIRIAWHAFYNCKNLKDLIIPDSVVEIADNAFETYAPKKRRNRKTFRSAKDQLVYRIIDCLITQGSRFDDTQDSEVECKRLASECAQEVLKRYPGINPATVNIDYLGDPMDVDCTELQIGEAYCFLVWEENKIYVDYIPEIYEDAGIAEESGPMN